MQILELEKTVAMIKEKLKDDTAEIFVTCGNEKFELNAIRTSTCIYINGMEVTNTVLIDLKKLVNL